MIDLLKDQTCDKLRAIIYLLKTLLNSTYFDLERKDIFDRLTFLLSMEKNITCGMMHIRLISLT